MLASKLRAQSKRATAQPPPRGSRDVAAVAAVDGGSTGGGPGAYFGAWWPLVRGALVVAALLAGARLLLLVGTAVAPALAGAGGGRTPAAPSHAASATHAPAVHSHPTAAEEARAEKAEAAAPTRPKVLTLLPSRNLDTVATFRSAHHAIVLLDYSKDGSVECDFCVWTMHTPGVKWELLDAFFDSDWFRQHRAEYEWLWYPDDDLSFAPGAIDAFLGAVTSQSSFDLVQPAVCEGSFVVHPSFGQHPNHTAQRWEHVRTVELQQPLGRLSWWAAVREKFIRGQTLGMGIDYFWAESIGFEMRTAVFDGVCARHADRPPGHRTGRDCPECNPNVPRTPLINEANAAKFGYAVLTDPAGYEVYFRRFQRWYVPLKGPDTCDVACGDRCLGSTSTSACAGRLPREGGLPAVGWEPRDDAGALDPLTCEKEAPPGLMCCVCVREDPLWPGGAASSVELKKRGLPTGFVAAPAPWAPVPAAGGGDGEEEAALPPPPAPAAAAEGEKKPTPAAGGGKAEAKKKPAAVPPPAPEEKKKKKKKSKGGGDRRALLGSRGAAAAAAAA